ncbi:MAG: hypothetical protein HOV80_08345, partial [Polyangiaceae bacterium]|nr:hypothetical protein [Polyangiaceae bacterium]
SEADETQCVDNAGRGGTETLTETVTAGTTYYIGVQSYSEGNDDTFTLTVAVN